jgi:ABC-type Fe3+ transport system substrate-binding protein
MSHSGNEQKREDAFEEVKQQYIDAGHTEEQAEALAEKFAEDNPDFWHGEEPLSYDGYELEDLSDMDREEPCI